MSAVRIAGDLRRELILSAAKRCFAQHGFAGTTTRRVAAEAGISEGLLFKHFPTKAALYAEILAAECEADPELSDLREREPSTATLVTLVRSMARYFIGVAGAPDQDEAQRLRLMVSSHLDDGEFARLIYGKLATWLGAQFVASLQRAAEAGDAKPPPGDSINLFWFAHHAAMMLAVTALPPTPCLAYGDTAAIERQVGAFILRGIGLSEAAIAAHWNDAEPEASSPAAIERATTESA